MQDPQHKRASLRRLGTLAVFLTAARYGSAQAQTPTLRVGVRGGTDVEIWEVVTQVAKKNGLIVKPVVVSGAASPNEALNNGDLEANSFQHVPFLRDQVQQRGYKLVAVGDTYISPIAFYSKKHKRFADLPENARLGIPNDPSNQTRALVVLRDQGVLTLRDGFDPAKGTATLADITGYRKKVQLVEAASVVLARSLEDLDASAIVNTFAYQAGLIATRDGLAVEKRENNPYVNIIVVREQDRGAAWVAPLVKSYQSPEVRAFIKSKYQGSVVPAF
ncbi:lipoprotein [Pseudorhodoferax aquiterrae]|uniref:Lipoprotein n=1 Tax=Pseudorhodoferax aquiterrae TaxID=747304 RepID=A0ABQ3FZD7_9BURK|nr:MetQ/NlpA family lipoprotein [Pseudorhodoferax aquiterrae]GHC78635.1 lipoprotein [Pseudorhodoferax aquiterrae]